MEKRHEINWGLNCIADILIKLNEKKALNWDIIYRKETEDTIRKLTDWERSYHHIAVGEEFIYIREVDTGDLLYAVNVTGDSSLTALGELFALLTKKF